MSRLSAEWVLQLGRVFRDGWAEASRFYQALMVLAVFGEQIPVILSEEAAQDRYDRLVAACVTDREELSDYLSFISDLREASVLNARTIRIAERLHGESLCPW